MASLSSLVSQLTGADSTSRNCVFGYVRRIEQLLSGNMMIPTDIYTLCLVYYVLVEKLTVFGNDMELSKSNNMVTKSPNAAGWSTVYGDIAISQQSYPFSIFEWTIQVFGFDKTNEISVAIGIEQGRKNRNSFIGYNTKYKNEKYYCLQLDQYAKLETNTKNRYLHKDKYGLCSPGDIIKMQLNTQKCKIIFYYNHEMIEYKWDNIDLSREYYFAICLYEENSCAQLISFNHGIS